MEIVIIILFLYSVFTTYKLYFVRARKKKNTLIIQGIEPHLFDSDLLIKMIKETQIP